ncbi:glutaredoxin [Candidatus Parcubacteria bacterium]|nr:glutaredoxin [Candidatus Parcubacteria bacterium]
MIKLYQAEWCPHSHKIRQRLTELGVPFIAMQVSVDREQRAELKQVSGQDTIPAVVLEDGTVLSGKDETILSKLNEIYPEPPEAAEHKEKDKKNYPFGG